VEEDPLIGQNITAATFFYKVGKMSFGAVFAVSIAVHLYSADGKFSF